MNWEAGIRTPISRSRVYPSHWTIFDEKLRKQITYSDLSPIERVKKYDSFSFVTGEKQADKIYHFSVLQRRAHINRSVVGARYASTCSPQARTPISSHGFASEGRSNS